MLTFALAGGDQSPENVESIVLLYRIDLVLLSIIGLLVVAKLPQAIALFGTTSEWLDGHFLRYVPYSPSVTRSYLSPISKTDFASNISHTLHSHNTFPTERVTEKGSPATMRHPPHVGSCISFLRPVLTLLRLRPSPGFSIAQSLIFVIYLACLGYAALYQSNIFTDQTRTAWIVIAQLPFLFLLAQKNNILGYLLGCSYEKVSYLPTCQKNNFVLT
jgi:ferric-chelate reductase